MLYLPQIITKDKNKSFGIHTILSTEEFQDNFVKEKPIKKFSTIENRVKLKRNVKLQELISAAIKSKFQSLSKAFRFFDC